jgi:2-keto-4-pentenoate hydratase/2-oxohepta-3-ene-1,7-dioic acid hydratase in catechol pathway
MRVVTFEVEGKTAPGLLSDVGEVVDLSEAGFASAIDLIEKVAAGAADLKSLVRGSRTHPLASVTLLAPIPKPRKLICVGLNYLDHAKESNLEIPKLPTIFNKFATSVIGPGAQIILPKVSTSPDYEGEFAVVVGRGGRHVQAEDWRDHVFGYTIINDVSARDYQRATTQWLMGKTFDTFAPMGPWIITADEISDPHALDIQTEINGELLQNSNTRELIFKVPELLAFLSSVFTLEPGDIISTGTPAGVGFARQPPRWLRPGDDVIVRIAGLGELRNSVVAEG